jgi:ATP-dependent Lhr-like helicase
MEARGEIRGGRFAGAFLGEQFALPEALDLLRAVRRAGESGGLPEASPTDPLYLAGVLLPGPRRAPGQPAEAVACPAGASNSAQIVGQTRGLRGAHGPALPLDESSLCRP